MEGHDWKENFFARAACFSIGLLGICGFFYLFCFVMQLGWYDDFQPVIGALAVVCFATIIWAIRYPSPKRDWLLRSWFKYRIGAVAISALLTLVVALPWFEYSLLIFRLFHTTDWFYALFTITIHLLLIFYVVISVPKLFMKLEVV